MFYFKLAINNIKQSFKYFAPFFLVSVTTFIFSTVTLLIMTSPTSKSMGTGTYALGLATIVLDILAAILCLYSYNFLLKQRNQEFGLYNILGMNKKNILWISTLELLVAYVVTVILGTLLSAVFSNFFYLVFVNMIQFKDLEFELTALAFIINIVLFAAIFLFLEFITIIRISRTSALNLFSNQSQGEREPRGNILLAFIAVSAIGYGYYLSVSSGKVNALIGINRFFIAILAVILGTYLFYISFITWYLKRRRKNKGYFYKPEHFVTTSQMIFRMKQNAIGLANITLLAIMAFVTIFSTVALYTSNKNLVKMNYPKNSLLEFENLSSRQKAEEMLQNEIIPVLKSKDPNFNKTLSQYESVSFTANYKDNHSLSVDKSFLAINPTKSVLSNKISIAAVMVMTQDDFRKIGNPLPKLAENEFAFYDYNQSGKSLKVQKVKWFNQTYHNVYQIKKTTNLQIMNAGIPSGIMVVSDDATLNAMRDSYNRYSRYPVDYDYQVFANLSAKERRTLKHLFAQNKGAIVDTKTNSMVHFSTAEDYRNEALKMAGGFLFTGFLLGIAFLLGAALIIYYKQLSEGTQDKRSYKILQEVGMSLQQVKKTINSQIILVFFMPLLMAIVHFIFALPILKKLLLLLGVQGDRLIYTVSALTISGILIVYFIIYKITSRTYYKIIER
ncbi:FtsX-like permease family protein [Streptococcus ratti]|uniref:ABC transporter, permease protein n=1 Tax=Streptococcus ratti FA-1 = DSM 20564 TaxID=699248 RepID=A0ABN0GUG1_STRRT|nr:ABC transporter permease [Streptococcus ratti]EJN93891.1 putative ABC transporter, permease protein [Streptococcus ratti FA-1 = DSM 20564]EMP71092.1 ABC transporter permease [Streptococcus ratti FA-1 = DSM 20564]QEY07738.1 ABC transporter permease [Streptococcus ratti]VEI60200.1 ABC transporter permease [Streptococcus mutans]